METTQVSFIRGFVEKCASKGWKPEQISEALGVLQLNELTSDPSFRSGFDKQAAGFMDSLNNLTPGQTAGLGALAGGVGGFVTGGKHKLRNALLGALGVGGAAYGISKYREGAPARAFGGASRGEAFGAPGSKTPDMGNAGNGARTGSAATAADGKAILDKALGAGDAVKADAGASATRAAGKPLMDGVLNEAGDVGQEIKAFGEVSGRNTATKAVGKQILDKALGAGDATRQEAAMNVPAQPSDLAKKLDATMTQSPEEAQRKALEAAIRQIQVDADARKAAR